MFIVYILYSASADKYYVGHTEDIAVRLEFHRSGKSPFTSRANDWELVHTEDYQNKTEALKREIAIKKRKSRKYIEWLINNR